MKYLLSMHNVENKICQPLTIKIVIEHEESNMQSLQNSMLIVNHTFHKPNTLAFHIHYWMEIPEVSSNKRMQHVFESPIT